MERSWPSPVRHSHGCLEKSSRDRRHNCWNSSYRHSCDGQYDSELYVAERFHPVWIYKLWCIDQCPRARRVRLYGHIGFWVYLDCSSFANSHTYADTYAIKDSNPYSNTNAKFDTFSIADENADALCVFQQHTNTEYNPYAKSYTLHNGDSKSKY